MTNERQPAGSVESGDLASLPDDEWVPATAAFGWLAFGRCAAAADIIRKLTRPAWPHMVWGQPRFLGIEGQGFNPVFKEMNALEGKRDLVVSKIRHGKLRAYVQTTTGTPKIVPPGVLSGGLNIGELTIHALMGGITRLHADFDVARKGKEDEKDIQARLNASDEAYGRVSVGGLTGPVMFRRGDLIRVFCASEKAPVSSRYMEASKVGAPPERALNEWHEIWSKKNPLASDDDAIRAARLKFGDVVGERQVIALRKLPDGSARKRGPKVGKRYAHRD
jgi:hypothetical protein